MEMTSEPSELLVSRGDRVLPEAPSFDPRRPSPRAAAGQAGYDDPAPLVIRLSPRKILLVATHCRGDEPPIARDESNAIVRAGVDMAAHGLSVVLFKRGRRSDQWTMTAPQKSAYNRRIHTGTRCKVTGPAAGDVRLRTTADPEGRRVVGTLGSGPAVRTPWDTVLTAEHSPLRHFRRGEGRGWSLAETRFHPGNEPHESNRFGWLVETDPRRPSTKPRKLTMLGRLDHADIVVRITHTRHVEMLFTDDADNLAYRFESRWRIDDSGGSLATLHNRRLVEAGTLSVQAEHVQPGRGAGLTWVPLTSDRDSYVEGMSVAETLIDPRLAVARVTAGGVLSPRHAQPA